MKEFFVEILCEEIPSQFQKTVAKEFKSYWIKFFEEKKLSATNIQSFITPRRLVFITKELSKLQPDIVLKHLPTKINKKKAKNLTLRKKIKEDDTFLYTKIIKKGQPTINILSENIMKIISSFPLPKYMRWGIIKKSWIRPIHSIIALFGGKILKKENKFNPYNIKIGNSTKGHRYMGNKKIVISSFLEYTNKLKQENVVLDYYLRKKTIIEQANKCVKDLDITWIYNDNLLDEVTGLVEWPIVLLGKIKKEFMSLPEEVIITYMQIHQRYFPCKYNNEKLAPYFLIISNIKLIDKGKNLIEANQRILHARLKDAQFCETQDKKESLETYANRLSELIFHKQLGNLEDKSKRMQYLVYLIATQCKINTMQASKATKLCKADLVTRMVTEFPNLQGTMGRYYAKDETEDIAKAIEEHYLPKKSSEPLPEGKLGKLIGLVDRIDTIVGFFIIKNYPTGSKDPYSLRRTSLSIVRIIESEFNVKLTQLISWSYDSYKISAKEKSTLEEIIKDILIFFKDRIKIYWNNNGMPKDIILSVINFIKSESLIILKNRIEKLYSFINSKNGKEVLILYRRTRNILKIEEKNDRNYYDDKFNEKLLEKNEEKILSLNLKKTKIKIKNFLKYNNFKDALFELSNLKDSIDNFFKNVTINNNINNIRINRLKLLRFINNIMETIAEFSYIKVKT